MKNKILILGLVIAALFIVACTDDNNQNSNVPNENANAIDEINNDASDDDSAINEVSNEDASRKLSQLLKNRNMRYTADYELTAMDTNQEITYVFDLPNFATIVKMDGTESRTIIKDSVAYMCTNAQGEWMCFKLTDVNMSSTEQVEVESYIKEGNVNVNYVGKCSRAGLSGDKYEVTSEGVTSTVCYTNRGILLEMESENVSMYATDVSESIDMRVFDLPAEPQDFGNLFMTE